MGKGRAPCCDKNQVKRGPWSPAEDLRLITFIQKHGHENWRALPKQAGLLRCGKSCRLRWINYLRPDVKRGNFTIEEEDIIIKLHQTLGNKWSKIASYLPGRTDNEIKNVWNTHLKKRVVGLMTKDDRESISNKECSSSTSSYSSNSTTNIVLSGQKRSMDHHQTQLLDINHHHDQLEEADDHDQCVTTKKARPNMEELLLPSDHLIDNSNLEEVNKSRPDDRDHHHHQDQVQGNDYQEIPLEVDYDFWDMLDGINYLQSIHGSNITLHPDIENRMWVRFLETELGIDDHQEITTINDDLAANKGTDKAGVFFFEKTDKAGVDPAGVVHNQFSP